MKYYEIHLTVDLKQKEEFLNKCNDNKIKTTEIIFPTYLNKENHLMTSIKVKCEEKDFNAIFQNYLYMFRNFNIIRSKVEVNYSPTFKYIESHLSVLNNNLDNFNKLNTSWVLSYNNNKVNRFSITKRVYDNEIDIVNDFSILKHLVLEEKLELEYCIIDNNRMLDANWI